jgi:dolichyl-phosphate-mannose--protein O-mannosyl transferase
MWMIRPSHHEDKGEYPSSDPSITEKTCTKAAEPVKCGSTIRLSNVETRRNLHSHNVPSPLSRQQEVSVFGGEDSKGDTGDDWIVECVKPGTDVWRRGENVRLLHAETKMYLGASKDAEFNEKTCGRNCPLMHHLESFGRGQKDALSEIQAEQGIYLHL